MLKTVDLPTFGCPASATRSLFPTGAVSVLCTGNKAHARETARESFSARDRPDNSLFALSKVGYRNEVLLVILLVFHSPPGPFSLSLYLHYGEMSKRRRGFEAG